MAEEELYTLSKKFIENILMTAKNVENTLFGKVKFVEYIILPDYGQRVVLRFDLIDNDISCIEKADELETDIRRLVGNDYWATLMGSVFHKFGFEADYIPQRLIEINGKLPNSVLQFRQTIHSEMIRQDSVIIRKKLKLTSEYLIWEIEVPIREGLENIVIRIVNTVESGEEMSLCGDTTEIKLGNKSCRIVYLKNSETFWGLIKAYCVAKQNNTALLSFIIRF